MSSRLTQNIHLTLPSFILAVDYFHTTFPGSTIIFDISLIYILTSLLAVLLNNLIMHMVSLTTRILAGYAISLVVSLPLLPPFLLTLGIIQSHHQ